MNPSPAPLQKHSPIGCTIDKLIPCGTGAYRFATRYLVEEAEGLQGQARNRLLAEVKYRWQLHSACVSGNLQAVKNGGV